MIKSFVESGARGSGDGPDGQPPEERGARVRIRLIGVLVVLGIGLFVANQFPTVIRPTLEILATSRNINVMNKMHEDLYRMFEEYGISKSWVVGKADSPQGQLVYQG